MTTTGLNSALMDTEPTQAVPTREDETQNIYAWSIDDAPDMVEVHHHSWKLPIAIAILALAAAITGIIQLSPNSTPPAATKPSIAAPATPSIQPTQTPAPAPIDPDQRFSNLLRDQGFVDVGTNASKYAEGGVDPGLVASAHSICTQIANGATIPQLVDKAMNGWNISQPAAAKFVTAALDVYCPQYLQH